MLLYICIHMSFKVYAREGSPKKVGIEDGGASAVLTLWPPHQDLDIKEGDSMTLYDGRVNSFNNEIGFDTSAGSLIEVSETKQSIYKPFKLFCSCISVIKGVCVLNAIVILKIFL